MIGDYIEFKIVSGLATKLFILANEKDASESFQNFREGVGGCF